MTNLVASSPRYLVVGGVFALLNTATLIALDRAGLHYLLGLLISLSVWVPLSYWVHLHFTYRVDGGAGSFARYFGAQLLNLPGATVLLFLFHDLGGLPMTWAAPAVMGLMLLYNIISSFWALCMRTSVQGG